MVRRWDPRVNATNIIWVDSLYLPGWLSVSQSKYTRGDGIVIYILCITHRQIHRLLHIYIIFTQDSDNTNPFVSTHVHDSIQSSVILLKWASQYP